MIVVALLVLVIAGCGSRGTMFSAEGLDTLYTPSHAAGFAVLRAGDSSTMIAVADPWQGAQDVEAYLFLSRGGERAPEGFDGVVVEAPLRRVVCMSSSYVAFIDALGETDAVVGVSGARFVHNAAVRENAREVGYDAQMNYELLAALRPDLVFVYGIAGENAQLTGKLNELGVPYFYIGEYVEQSPLGRAEWLVAFGEMFDRRGEAEEMFEQTRDRYMSVMELVSEVDTRPRVMFNAPYRDVWYLPAAGNYLARLVSDAGGDYDGGEGTNESKAVGSEQAYVMALDTDVWLNPGHAVTLDEVLAENPRFERVTAVVNGRVYNCNACTTPAGGNDFWESGVVHPDVVLKDLVKILHPKLLPGHELRYFRHLAPADETDIAAAGKADVGLVDEPGVTAAVE